MYQKISKHEQVMKKYANKLIAEKVVSEQDFAVSVTSEHRYTSFKVFFCVCRWSFLNMKKSVKKHTSNLPMMMMLKIISLTGLIHHGKVSSKRYIVNTCTFT